MRYLTIATGIVFVLILIITLIPHVAPQFGLSHYSSSTSSPSSGSGNDTTRTPAPVRGEAPWAFSALPECFRQDSRRTGPAKVARTFFPKAARLLSPGTQFTVADCSVAVEKGTITVSRGDDRLEIPPPAKLWGYRGHIVLDRFVFLSEEIRIYEFVGRPHGRF